MQTRQPAVQARCAARHLLSDDQQHAGNNRKHWHDETQMAEVNAKELNDTDQNEVDAEDQEAANS
jgi:hypothetical protein